MNKKVLKNRFQLREIVHFIVHLRWHYQLFILSGGFLAGGYLSETINWGDFFLQFLNVHLLLFGGATAYNSYWDNDTGPIGGLQSPPPTQQWMWFASLGLQLIGLGVALLQSATFVIIYAMSMLLFWLYSSPHFRWKGKPLLSLVAIGISTGANSLLLGFLAGGQAPIGNSVFTASIGVACMILSIYPVSQLYQIDDDLQRGDETFVIKFGVVGMIYFFRVMFFGGVLLLGLPLIQHVLWAGIVFVVLSSLTGFWVDIKIRKLAEEPGSYAQVMRIKYVTSMAFVLFFSVLLLWDYIRLN